MTKKTFRNYHGMLSRLGDAPNDWWRCEYCGQEGRYDDVWPTQCAHVYTPCKHCGGSENSNECRPDCRKIAEILSDPKLYKIGFDASDDG